MKKLFALLLALLMLCGCGTETPKEPTTAETPTTTQAPTEEVVVSHEVLELHDLPYEDIRSAAPLGDDILLVTGNALIKLDGKRLKEISSASSCPAPVQVSETDMCCRDGEKLIFLDENLEETGRLALPNADCVIAVAADLNTIYYAAGGAIRAIDRETGLDRLLRETTYTELTVEGLYLDDSVIACTTPGSTLFYAAATGELLNSYEGNLSLASDGELWLAEVSDADKVFGIGNGEMQVLETDETVYPVPGLGGVLLAESGSIRFCDLQHNTETAAVALEGAPTLLQVWGDEDAGCIWLLLDDDRLGRWDLTKMEALDAIACLAPYYTRENPDTEGLAALGTKIQELETSYGVAVHIAEDAVAVQPGDGALISEYRVDALQAGLESLEAALGRFTPAFLTNAGKASNDGMVHISLVRSVSGGCIQFWDSDGNARIALSVGDTVEQDFYHGMAHIIDARVMSECSTFDNWERLNPKGFDYDYDYTANQSRDGSAYAGAFIDTFSMSFPTEDRASVLEYAMMAGNDSRFQSEAMQKKLSTLCSGIRKAFGLKDSEEVFPWEQYLAE